LLVLINAFVGGMVGIERTVVPLVGTEEFRIGSEVVVFSFIIAFGVIKALLNLVSGLLADRFTRKMVLVAGWVVGLPVPFMLAWGRPGRGSSRRTCSLGSARGSRGR
jgi:MFS family permease